MPKAARISVKGTRGDDTIAVVSSGIVVNGVLKPYAADQLAAGVTINGDAGNDHISGGGGGDQLLGFSGSDTLVGGDGFDSLSGGDGNDTMIDAVDGASFDGGMGVDLVDLSATTRNVLVDIQGTGLISLDIQFHRDPFSVGGEVLDPITGRLVSIENLRTGSGDDSLTGNSSANVFEAGAGADSLWGRAGNDTLYGGDGDDHLAGEQGADQLYGGGGADVFWATAGSGHDMVMDYDAGDRIYFWNTAKPTQWTVSGNSLVGTYDSGASSITILNLTDISQLVVSGQIFGTTGDDVLTSNGDYDQLWGREGNDTLSGNGGDDHLLGEAGNDLLYGGSGNDILDGGLGADSMWGDAGNDTYWVNDSGDVVGESAGSGTDHVFSGITYALSADVENLTLIGTGANRADGNSLDNVITGNSGANIVNGSLGADTMIGGAGDDTYYVHDSGDLVVEDAGGGIDWVYSVVSHTLNANVENLSLAGSGAMDGAGNALPNWIGGNADANTLAGGLGADTLWGGAGGDSFLFDSALGAGNVDQILDFSAADDTIVLDQSVFSAIAATGTLDSTAFAAGTSAQDANDRIIYDSATGSIYYDADGNGAGAAVLFAQVAAGSALTSADFVLTP